MDLRKLRYFVAICETGSISKAAARLSVAQSALSKHLADLEDELGTDLVIRSPAGVVPTPGGRILLDHARAILAKVEDAKAEVRSHQGMPQVVVNLGLPESLSPALGLTLLTAVREQHPQIELHLHEGDCSGLAARLVDGQMDLAILFGDRAPVGLAAAPLAIASLYLVSGRSTRRPPTQGRTTLAAALASPLILPSLRQGIRSCVAAHARESALEISHLLMETDSLTVIKSAVLARMAKTILPAAAVMSECALGQMQAQEIVKPELSCRVLLCSVMGGPARPPAQRVASLVRLVSADLLATGRWPGARAPTADAS